MIGLWPGSIQVSGGRLCKRPPVRVGWLSLGLRTEMTRVYGQPPAGRHMVVTTAASKTVSNWPMFA